MKASLSLFVLSMCLLIAGTTYAQNFEGIITYRYKYKDKTGFLKPKEVKKLIGTQQTMYVKNGKYKSRLNGVSKTTQTYLGRDTIYMTEERIRAVMCIDATQKQGDILSHNITRKAARINGLKCDMLEVKTTKGALQYYFHADYTVNKEHYANHQYNWWAFCMEQTGGALPIKFILTTKKESVKLRCKRIRKQRVEENTFDLPTGVAYIEKPEGRLR